jgi:arylsulfatase A-like enzyme
MKTTLIILMVSLTACTVRAAEKPNVIVLLADDLGYADVGYHGFPAGKDVFTPNIDRLTASGTAFSNGYVACSTCGPSRASLLTGRSASRFGIEDNDQPLSKDEILIPAL